MITPNFASQTLFGLNFAIHGYDDDTMFTWPCV